MDRCVVILGKQHELIVDKFPPSCIPGNVVTAQIVNCAMENNCNVSVEEVEEVILHKFGCDHTYCAYIVDNGKTLFSSMIIFDCYDHIEGKDNITREVIVYSTIGVFRSETYSFTEVISKFEGILCGNATIPDPKNKRRRLNITKMCIVFDMNSDLYGESFKRMLYQQFTLEQVEQIVRSDVIVGNWEQTFFVKVYLFYRE